MLTKTDGLEPEMVNERVAELEKLSGREVKSMSSTAGTHVKDVLRRLYKLAAEAAKNTPEPEATETHEDFVVESSGRWSVEKLSDTEYRIHGKSVEKHGQRAMQGNWESMARLRGILEKKGVIKKLEREGAGEGTVIRVADVFITL